MQANGRINLLDAPNPMMMFDRNPVKTPVQYRDAMSGGWECSRLSKAFFSGENQQIIQNGIRAGVYQASNNQYVIAPQSYDQIKIIMRAIYLQNAQNHPENITGQIERLNQLVIQHAVPKLVGEAKGYMNYLRDASTIAMPLSAPINTMSRDKTLELKPFF
jgi:hypothetical protein